MLSAPNRVSSLFCKKWESMERNFIEYFQKQWLRVHCNWFEGAADYTPSTNNALESHNAIIKWKITLRQRLPLNQFLIAMAELTTEISTQFFKNQRAFASEPTIPNAMMTEAALMQQENFKCFKAKCSTNDTLVFLTPSRLCEESIANESYYRSLVKRQCTSFDEFIKHGYQKFYIVHLWKASWNTKSTCQCVSFFKQNICKHIIAISLREGIIKCPDSAIPTLLATNKKRPGRPKGAAKALIVQWKIRKN